MKTQIATTILQQIGGRRFAVMTGAKDFVALVDGVVFSLPSRFAKDGINLVKIRLGADDLYTMEFSTRRGVKVREMAVEEGVYCDELAARFTRVTGLDTCL